jgi:hypothetical protein
MSLKDELFQTIKNAYPMSINIREVEAIAHRLDRKVSNAERKLRDFCDEDHKIEMKTGKKPSVKAFRNVKKAIIAYQYIPENELRTEKPKAVAQGELFKFNSPREFMR